MASLAKTDRKIREAIRDKIRETKPEITERAIRHRIHAVREEFSKTISPKMAANILASRMGIDVYRILEADELKELRSHLGESQPKIVMKPTEGPTQEKEYQITIGKKIVDAFGLPQSLAREAERMADVYPYMYVFENLVRHVVKSVLEQKYRRTWWNQPGVVSRKIRENVEGRKREERKNRWHTKRGSHEIFYTDFSDLNRIITTNPNEFKKIFADSEIQSHMRQLEHSRNIIAHNNPLPSKEINRIKMYLDDLKRQLRSEHS